jgi:hypothetical protein
VIPPEALCFFAGFLLVVSLIFLALIYFAWRYMTDKTNPRSVTQPSCAACGSPVNNLAAQCPTCGRSV